MDYEKTRELIKNIYMNEYSSIEIDNYIQLNYGDFIEILSFIEKNFGFQNNYMHLYIIFLESYLKTNRNLPENISIYLKYIFENLSEIAKNNIYVNRFLSSSSYDNFLFSNQVLHLISTFDITKFDNVIKKRLVEGFIYEYEQGILLKNYNFFFRKILDNIIETNISLLNNTSINFKVLIYYFGYEISDSVKIINKLEENGTVNYIYYSDVEAGLINNIGEKKFIQELNKLDYIDAVRFIDGINTYIDFLTINNIEELKIEIIFYLSLLYSKKLFENNQNKNFFDYYLKLIKRENISLLKKINNTKSIDKIFKFLINNEINFFEHKEFTKIMFKIIVEELLYSFEINNIINIYKQYFIKNFEIVLESINSPDIKLKNINLFGEILFTISTGVLERGDLKSFIKIIDSNIFSKLDDNQKFNINKTVKLACKYGRFSLLKYKEIEKILLFILNEKYFYETEIMDFLKVLFNSGQKCNYIIGKNIKKIEKRIGKYYLKDIKEKIFYSRIFPFIIFHYLNYKKE